LNRAVKDLMLGVVEHEVERAEVGEVDVELCGEEVTAGLGLEGDGEVG
jgi:hypothetical protein